MVNSIWILGFHKNSGFCWWKLKEKQVKNIKENSLKHPATEFGF